MYPLMDFLLDAQLPRRLAYRLRELGHDALHTLDLPNGNRTSDAEICEWADQERRIVMTKDADFVASHVLRASPERLLLVSTGNLSNADLEALVVPRVSEIERLFSVTPFVEITRTTLIARG